MGVANADNAFTLYYVKFRAAAPKLRVRSINLHLKSSLHLRTVHLHFKHPVGVREPEA